MNGAGNLRGGFRVYKWQATIRCRAPWGQHLGDPSIGTLGQNQYIQALGMSCQIQLKGLRS